MADKRIYEVVFIVNPDADDNEVMRLSEAIQKIATSQGGSITKTEVIPEDRDQSGRQHHENRGHGPASARV